MTRYREDFPFPVAFDEREVHEHARRGAVGARPAPAPRRGDREVRARDVLLQRRRGGASGRARRGSSCPRRATSPSYDLKPEMSAAEVARRVVRRDRRRLRVRASSTSRTPTWSATRARSRRSSPRSRRRTRRSVASSSASTRLGGVCLVTADHGNAEQMLEPDGVSPHTAHTTNPVPLVVTTRRFRRCARTGGLSDLAPTILGMLGRFDSG